MLSQPNVNADFVGLAIAITSLYINSAQKPNNHLTVNTGVCNSKIFPSCPRWRMKTIRFFTRFGGI
jgi:hypothetical protein